MVTLTVSFPVNVTEAFFLSIRFTSDTGEHSFLNISDATFVNTNSISYTLPENQLPRYSMFSVSMALIINGVVGSYSPESNRISELCVYVCASVCVCMPRMHTCVCVHACSTSNNPFSPGIILPTTSSAPTTDPPTSGPAASTSQTIIIALIIVIVLLAFLCIGFLVALVVVLVKKSSKSYSAHTPTRDTIQLEHARDYIPDEESRTSASVSSC